MRTTVREFPGRCAFGWVVPQIDGQTYISLLSPPEVSSISEFEA